ncbi:MAG: phosphotransferase [Actinomycetota bacterium]|nr:phosphotransferase [Actinomycetota bacterium]
MTEAAGPAATPATAPGPGPALDRLLDKVPELRGRREVEELAGGLTNRNYKVVSDQGAYVVRVSPREADALAINRENEYENSVRAAAAGVGAPVIAFLPEDGITVIGFLDGETYTDESFQAPGVIPRVAQAVRQLHGGQRFVNDFNMFEIQRQYLTMVRHNGLRLPGGYQEFEPHVARIKAALAVNDDGTVPCNNDLLAANFIDDGAKIWLIDYEYAGNNDACFELGNIWSECHLSRDQLTELVHSYYGRPSRNKVARAQLQGLMSRYGWTLWASIQDGSSPLDFDFWSWGMQRYDNAVRVFTSPDFDQLLEEAQRPD